MGHAMNFTRSFSHNAGSVRLSNGQLTAASYTFLAGTVDLGTGGQGNLTVPGGLSIPNGAILTGIGTVTANVTNAGTVDFGQGGARLGQLTVSGNYTQAGTGTLRLRIVSPQNQQYDRLNVTGTATLGGTLQVTAGQGFVATLNDTYTLLTYGQVVGDFNRPYTLPALPQGRTWAILFPANQLQIKIQ
jgi:hypothetical protein